jgi:RNA polymerase sigma-70 factor (ECF subfamily)
MTESCALKNTRPDIRSGLGSLAPALRLRALQLCRSESEAEDLVQDAILRALEFEDSFEPGTNLRAWVYQVLFSVFATRCRRKRRERRALESLRFDPCAWTQPDVPRLPRQLTRTMRGALDNLPVHFAAAVRLVDLDDLSYKEAAAALSVPVGTVMSRLFRARRLLASALNESEPLAA